MLRKKGNRKKLVLVTQSTTEKTNIKKLKLTAVFANVLA